MTNRPWIQVGGLELDDRPSLIRVVGLELDARPSLIRVVGLELDHRPSWIQVGGLELDHQPSCQPVYWPLGAGVGSIGLAGLGASGLGRLLLVSSRWLSIGRSASLAGAMVEGSSSSTVLATEVAYSTMVR